MNKKIRSALLAMLFVMNSLAGCAGQGLGQAALPAEPAAKTAAAIQFTDDMGREILLEAPCRRIISLYSAHTENLYFLGAGDAVVGGHNTCVFPAEAAFKEVYDYNGDPEQIIAAEPDLVLLRPFIERKVPDFVAVLEKAGIQVVSLYPERFEDFDDYIRKLALLTGTTDKAETLLKDFHQKLQGISDLTAQAVEKQSIFFESTEVDLRTVTEDSMPAHGIALSGGINVAAGAKALSQDSSIAAFGSERILELAEDIDVYVSQRGAMNAGGDLISIKERPGFSAVKAVQAGRVYVINEKIISSPTFRYYVGVRELARYLYPSLMDDMQTYDSSQTADKRDFAKLVVMGGHLPVFVPSSSKYYATEKEGHIYGLFQDAGWSDPDYDDIETAVQAGFVQWRLEDGKHFFDPDSEVSRQELARAVYLMGDFEKQAVHAVILDLEDCDKPNMIQTLVDNSIFSLEDGCFNPSRPVTQAEIAEAMKKIQ